MSPPPFCLEPGRLVVEVRANKDLGIQEDAWHPLVYGGHGHLKEPSGVFQPWREVEQCPVLVALQEAIQTLPKPVLRGGSACVVYST